MHHKYLAQWVAISVAIILVASNAVGAKPSGKNDWRPLFNGKDLSGWHVILTPDKKGIDPERVFQVHEGVIHVYRDVPQGAKVPIGYLASDDSYSWYHLRLEFRWIGKRFGHRITMPRDAGVLYHAGAEKKVWPRSIECQIQEGDVGDCFTVNGTQVQTTVDPEVLKTGLRRYLPAEDGGVDGVWGGPSVSRIVKSATHEVDGWNTVEVIVRGDEEAIHRINGHEVFRARNLQHLDADELSWVPLKFGHLLLQAEYAEVQYRNLQIKPIEGGPLQVSKTAPSSK
jgi:hypothetical protein